MIVVVDYGMGNLHSVYKAFKRVKTEVSISSSIEDIKRADKLVLPGVGHFKKGMENLRDSGILDILNKKVIEKKTPILGICLGMQLLTEFSEEGSVKGLGWIRGKTVKLNLPTKFKIPHMGWNNLTRIRKSSLLDNIDEASQFYFVHSFHVLPQDSSVIITKTKYGVDFVSALQKDNIIGTQFHPEKSHSQGLNLIKNFISEQYV